MLTESVSCAFYLHDEYTEFRAYELTNNIFLLNILRRLVCKSFTRFGKTINHTYMYDLYIGPILKWNHFTVR